VQKARLKGGKFGVGKMACFSSISIRHKYGEDTHQRVVKKILGGENDKEKNHK
jgi:hypothetical protein